MNKAALENVAGNLNALFSEFFNVFQEPSVFLQVGFVAASFLAAWGLDRLTRGPIEKSARNIKGAPRVLRVVSALRRRMQLVFFVLMLWLGVVFDRAAGGPSSQILSIVLSLSLAYLLIAVAS
ncbi:MAG: mechanosensitive ion channel family protein, partial [Alphaproteobacteria bacterium]